MTTGSIFNPAHNSTKIRYRGLVLSCRVSHPAKLRAVAGELSRGGYGAYICSCRGSIPRAKAGGPNHRAIRESLRQSSEHRALSDLALRLHARFERTASPTTRSRISFSCGRAGHCEYFASAMTVMLRAEGVPARYVTGFLARRIQRCWRRLHHSRKRRARLGGSLFPRLRLAHLRSHAARK